MNKPVVEKAIDKVVCCSNNHRFRVGITGDGYRNCPECNDLLKQVHADVTKGEPFTLQYLSQAFIKKKEPKSSTGNLSIDVAMNTDRMQLKLRAIAKHAEALADELDAIDNAWQCDCGSFKCEYSKFFSGDSGEEPYLSYRECLECGEQYVIPSEPTVSDA